VATEPVDPETLAALLDNRLDAAERERVLGALARDPESYAAFLETSALLAELEAAPAAPVGGAVAAAHDAAPAPVPGGPGAVARADVDQRGRPTLRMAAPAPGTPAVGRRGPFGAPALRWLAAASLLVVAGGGWWARTRQGVEEPGPVAAAGAGPVLPLAPLFSGSRAGDAALTPAARATRLGIALADLEVQVAARDTAVRDDRGARRRAAGGRARIRPDRVAVRRAGAPGGGAAGAADSAAPARGRGGGRGDRLRRRRPRRRGAAHPVRGGRPRRAVRARPGRAGRARQRRGAPPAGPPGDSPRWPASARTSPPTAPPTGAP
jgi:hypothetical protein